MKKILTLIVLFAGFGPAWAAPQQPTTAQSTTRINATYVQGVAPGYRPTAGSGLALNVAAGTAFCGGAAQSYSGGTLSLAASATNYVYLDPTLSCAPNTNTTGFTSTLIPVAIVATSSSAITTITDVRTWFVAPSSGVVTGSCPANQFMTALGSIAPTCAQPGFASLSGTASIAQLPLATAASQGILQLSGDLSGSAAAPVVAGLQGKPVSSTAPSANQLLGWSGSQWTPTQPSFSSLSGAVTPAQLPAASATAQGAIQLTGDLGGTASTPAVSRIQGVPVATAAPTVTQVLTYNGSAWTPTTPAAAAGVGSCSASQYVTATTSGTPNCAQPAFSGLTGTASAAQLPAATTSAQGALQLAGDLSGTSSTPRVASLQGNAVSSTAPSSNQVLTWSGSSWAPATPATGAGLGSCAANQYVTATNSGAPTCAQPAFSGLTGSATSAQLPAASVSALGVLQLAGDLSGTASGPQVLSTHLASPLTPAQGGSGAATFTAHGLLLGEGASTFGVAGPGTSGQCLVSNGSSADPSFAACPSGGGAPGGSSTQFEFNNSGAFGGASNHMYNSSTGMVTLNQMANGNDTFFGARATDTSPTGNLIHFQNNAKTADLFKVDASGNVTATSFTSTATGPFVMSGTEGACSGAASGKDVLCLGDTTTHTAQVSLNGGSFVPIPQLAGDLGGTAASPQVVSTHLASPLTPAQGGSGAGTFTAHGLLLGEGTSAFGVAGPGTSGQCLVSNGASADPSFATCPGGGGGAPGGSSTQFEFNNSGAFGGSSNLTYASATGVVTLNQLSNGNDTFFGVRFTDTSPTGNLIHFQNNAKTADLFKVDASGNVTATSFTSTATGPFVMSGTEGTCSGAAAGKDVLCLGDATTHTAQVALNGGSFVPIPQLAGDLGGTAASPQVVSTHLGHLNQTSASGDLAGTISVSAATSASHTFAVAFNAAPICVLTPISKPGITYWVTASTTQVTANVSASATITFNYHCVGNPN